MSIPDAQYYAVDLGAKRGGALEYFMHSANAPNFDSGNCRALAVDHSDEHAEEIHRKGFDFLKLALPAKGLAFDDLPQAEHYLAWDFLEHLPVEDAELMIFQAMRRTSTSFWVRTPNFEKDDPAVRELKAAGLRCTWTHWTCHRNHVQLGWLITHMTRAALLAWEQSPSISVRATKVIRSTAHESIVPIKADVGVDQYSSKLGRKPTITLNPPLVYAWDVLASRR